MTKKPKISGLKRRGNVYYLWVREPAEFADVEQRSEVSRFLFTGGAPEAKAMCANARAALRAEWQTARAGRRTDIRRVFEASSQSLKAWGMTFSPMEYLVKGPMEELLARIEKIANLDVTSAATPTALGAIDLPDCSLHEMAAHMPVLNEADIRAKNPGQRREWSNNFKRAAKDFTTHIGQRTVLTICEQDATDYEDYWKKRVRSGTTANYANKQIRYVRQMVDAHLIDTRMPRSKRKNAFTGMKVAKIAYTKADQERRKLALPDLSIKERLIKEKVLAGLNDQASGITIIDAVSVCRASEIYNLPPEDIHLDHEIPHVVIRMVIDGRHRREIKNQPSMRCVVLVRPALEATRRNSNGFSRYRSKASYSNSVNNYPRANGLFPELPEDATERYVISGTRHTFENRMVAATIGKEERAFLMGHSIGKVRSRPVYGSDMDLPL